eukprot:2692486-Rhodomonas_salina.1
MFPSGSISLLSRRRQAEGLHQVSLREAASNPFQGEIRAEKGRGKGSRAHGGSSTWRCPLAKTPAKTT